MKHMDFRSMMTSVRDDKGRMHEKKLPYGPLPSNFHLYLVGDPHIGNAAVSEKMIVRAVKDIKSKKHSRVALLGDHLETITVSDKRYDISVHGHRMARFNAQRDRFMELFEPISDRVLWLLDGNHERKICNIYLPNADIAKSWRTVYANGSLVKAIFEDWRLATWHGAGIINSRAGDSLQRSTNMLIALKRNMRSLPVDDCDVVACGHYHQCLCHAPENRLVLLSEVTSEGLELKHKYTKPGRMPVGDDGLYRIHEDDRYWMSCGGFLRAYSEDMPSYTEDRGLQATEMGYGHIQVNNGKPAIIEVVKMV